MTSPSSAVVLIGPMGAGKTSVGKRVARALDVPFFDTDAAVVRSHGPIDRLFEEHGEPYFRTLERAAVEEGLTATRSDLAQHRVVLLTVAPRVVALRVRGSSRPLLQGDEDAMTRWTRIYEERRPVYEELADATFDTSSGPLQNVVDRIVAWVRGDEAPEPHKGEA